MLQVRVAMSPGHSGPGSVRRPLMEGSKEITASKIITLSLQYGCGLPKHKSESTLNDIAARGGPG